MFKINIFKKCSQCKHIHKLSNFKGLRGETKTCVNCRNISKKHRIKNRENINKKAREYKKLNPEKYKQQKDRQNKRIREDRKLNPEKYRERERLERAGRLKRWFENNPERYIKEITYKRINYYNSSNNEENSEKYRTMQKKNMEMVDDILEKYKKTGELLYFNQLRREKIKRGWVYLDN